MWEVLQSSLAVALSAFAGATAAFLRERYSARLDRAKRDYASLREAHFALMQQHAALVLFRDQFLVPEAGSAAPWLTMLPGVGFFDAPRLDVSKLTHILEGAEPDLLNRMLVAQHKFLALHAFFEQRNQAHCQFQERLAALEREGTLSSTAPLTQIEAKVGQPIVGRLKSLTAAILEFYPNALAFQDQQLKDLAAYTKRAFPKRREPEFALIPPSERQ